MLWGQPSPHHLSGGNSAMPEKRPYLAVNQVLEPGDSLVSPNGKYVAFLQDSGQLGLCFTVEGSSAPDWNRCYWRTPVSPGNQPWGVMPEDGNFVLYYGKQGGTAAPYFASNTNVNRAFVTTVLDDGNLVVCTGTPEDPEEIVWSALPQVARTVTSGQARSTVSVRAAAASSRCSQVSRHTSIRRRLSRAARVRTRSPPGSRRTRRAVAVVRAIRSGSVTEPRSTSQKPSGHRSAILLPNCTASRVLPLPPAPVSVTSRRAMTSRSISSSSESRPILQTRP